MTTTKSQFRAAYQQVRIAIRAPVQQPKWESLSGSAIAEAMASFFMGRRSTLTPSIGAVCVYPLGLQHSLSSGMAPDARLSYLRRLRELRGVK